MTVDERVSLRDSWEFSFPRHELLAASKEREASHGQHKEYWARKLKEWDAEMTKTARVEDVPVTGGIQRSLRYDPGLQQKVNMATTKRDSHASSEVRFARWVLTLEKMSEGSSLRLRFGDVTFFFEPVEELPEEEENG